MGVKGQIPWNKGKKLGYTPPMAFKKGHKPSQGAIEATKARKGVKHPMWKGSKVTYRPLHNWVQRTLGTPKVCTKCFKAGLTGKQINWANKSGKYKRDPRDWIRLCSSCHKKYDLKRLNKRM